MAVEYSIIVPAHNEELRISPMLDAYLDFFSAGRDDKVEFIVVVNGSSDRSEDVVRGYARGSGVLRVLVEPRRIGKGGALIMGLKEARGDYVGFVDADGSTPPEAFQDLIDHRRDADCIIASRYLPESTAEPRQPWRRRIASRIMNLLVRIMFGLRLTDTQCGAKLIRREAVGNVLPLLGQTQWAFDVDLLFQLKRCGHSIKEIPTVWHDIAGSKLRIVHASLTMLVSMFRMRILHSPFKWLIPIFNRTIGRLIPYSRMRR